jgi:hypothetical protein
VPGLYISKAQAVCSITIKIDLLLLEAAGWYPRGSVGQEQAEQYHRLLRAFSS